MAVMESFFLFLFQGLAILFAKEDSTHSRSALFATKESKRLDGNAVKQFRSPTQISCSLSCLKNSWCTSTNFEEPSKKDDKGTCELNRHGILDGNAQFSDQKGFIFSMMLKGCLMTGCRNGGSCLFHEKNQTFSCSCIHPWTGDDCQII
ncbi:uncharacterized protein LOC111319706, partial [Stylophora pistillata]|uniref:uncharacterized protein LOC111319706 n=1 Tax=Stylophora pistillata TaxID=50429 RepID=UPI000C0491A7